MKQTLLSGRWRVATATAVALIPMVVLSAMMAMALTGDTTADVVLGQLDFSHNLPNLIDGRGLNLPSSVAIDTSAVPNRLYVADAGNNRVLGYEDVTSFVNGSAADLVIGQPDFLSNNCGLGAKGLCSPFGVAVDSSGNLYVADNANSRVLEFNTPLAGWQPVDG
jgi:DNA-binding beta-propeller fold protein YncE